MDVKTLWLRLSSEGIVRLARAEWEEVAGAFPELERHDTHLAGDLVIVGDADGPVAVEEPDAETRVLRRLSGPGDVRRFVQDRLETYERMWDGCGCKVEYFR